MAFIEWQETTKEIEKNKQKRVKWRELFGMSLTKYITLLKNKGLSSQEIIHGITRRLEFNGFKSDRLAKLIKISVNARFAEQEAAFIRSLKKNNTKV